MADKIVIKIKPYQGEYELDLEEEAPTGHEWRWIKKVSGYLPLTIEDGLRGGDPDLFIALAVVALHRAGRVGKDDALRVADVLAEAPFDGVAIRYVADEQEAETGPPEVPAETPATETPPSSSGGSSKQTSDPQGNGRSRTGTDDSARSAVSGPVTSAT